MSHVIQQIVDLSFDYPVIFVRDLFAPENPTLRTLLEPHVHVHPRPLALFYIEERVAVTPAGLMTRMAGYFREQLPGLTMVGIHVVGGGEAVKSDHAVAGMIRGMSEARLDRHSYIIGVGGGALLDAVGYAASLVHRGLRMIRIPTTVLAQCDGGVGVKTAINTPDGKNFLGTFAPPFAVINDAAFLASLPDVEWRAGIAEAFKVAMIKDAAFFDWLCGHAVALSRRDAEAMDHLIFRCAELHLQHIREGGDPFERGAARPLDFGHWSAHQLERMSGFALGHGAAVAIGIALDALYAVRSGLLPDDVAQRLIRGLETVGFDLWHDALHDTGELLAGLDRFREHLGGNLSITLPCAAGRSVEITQVDASLMQSCLRDLFSRIRSASCT